jgi:hypothetical protein
MVVMIMMVLRASIMANTKCFIFHWQGLASRIPHGWEAEMMMFVIPCGGSSIVGIPYIGEGVGHVGIGPMLIVAVQRRQLVHRYGIIQVMEGFRIGSDMGGFHLLMDPNARDKPMPADHKR